MSRSLLSDQHRHLLADLAGERLRFDEPMSRRTTLKLGGPADALFVPETIEELRAVVAACATHNLPMLPVGGGSNLLVRDGGIRGVVIATRNLRHIERIDDTSVQVEAGLSTGKLLSLAIKWSLGGLEFLGGVPGSVGGGMVMNAGTYLGEFKDVTTEVISVRLDDGELIRRDNASCGFVYRGSDLPATEIVAQVSLRLRPRSADEIRADVAGLRKRRKEREPTGVHNAGSTFKNPEGDYAGRLIETAGLKGTRIGGALCSPAHANWLVNDGSATATQMLELIELVRTKVRELHGVDLRLEFKVVGEDLPVEA